MKKAKSKIKRRVKSKSIQVHISTKKGIGIITLFFIIFATIVLLISNSQNTNSVLNSNAADKNSTACASIGGTCESTGNPNGEYFHNLCPGPVTEECFVSDATLKKGGSAPKGEIQSQACTDDGGTCESTSDHPTRSASAYYIPNLCPGPATWQCYVSSAADTGLGTTCTTPQGKGICELTNSGLEGEVKFIPGHCPGPSAEECMVKDASSPPVAAKPVCAAPKVECGATKTCLTTAECNTAVHQPPKSTAGTGCPVGEAICGATKTCLTTEECTTAVHAAPPAAAKPACAAPKVECAATKSCLTTEECTTAVHAKTAAAGGQSAVLNCVGGAGQPPCATPAPNPTVVIAAPITNTGGSNANASLLQQIISLLQQLQNAL